MELILNVRLFDNKLLSYHRRRWDKSTLNLSGTTVLQQACGKNIILRFGKIFNISVVKKRSSPSNKRFFLCSAKNKTRRKVAYFA